MTILLDPVSLERGLRIGAVEGSSGAFFGLSLKAPSKRTGPADPLGAASSRAAKMQAVALRGLIAYPLPSSLPLGANWIR